MEAEEEKTERGNGKASEQRRSIERTGIIAGAESRPARGVEGLAAGVRSDFRESERTRSHGRGDSDRTVSFSRSIETDACTFRKEKRVALRIIHAHVTRGVMHGARACPAAVKARQVAPADTVVTTHTGVFLPSSLSTRRCC